MTVAAVETPAASTPESPVKTESQAPAPAAPATATPAQPAALTKSKPPAPEQPVAISERRKEVLEALAKSDKAKGVVPVKSDPAPVAATPAKTEDKKEQATEPTPAASTPAAPAPTEPPPVEAVVVKGADKEGKAVDVTVTRAQAIQSLLRAGIPADAIADWSKKRVLEIGAQQFLRLQQSDREWSRISEERRRAGANPATAATAPQAPTADPSKEQVPPAAAQQSPSQTQPAAGLVDPDEQYIKLIEDEAGPKIASSIRALLASRKATAPAQAQPPQELMTQFSAVQDSLRRQEEVGTVLGNLLMQERFDHAVEGLVRDYPQLDGTGGETLRTELAQTHQAIIASGRYPNAYYNRGDYNRSLREAAHGLFGEQEKEIHARQLVGRQEKQAAGQVPVSPSRTEDPAPALSRREAMKRAAMMVQRTDITEANKWYNETLNASG